MQEHGQYLLCMLFSACHVFHTRFLRGTGPISAQQRSLSIIGLILQQMKQADDALEALHECIYPKQLLWTKQSE